MLTTATCLHYMLLRSNACEWKQRPACQSTKTGHWSVAAVPCSAAVSKSDLQQRPADPPCYYTAAEMIVTVAADVSGVCSLCGHSSLAVQLYTSRQLTAAAAAADQLVENIPELAGRQCGESARHCSCLQDAAATTTELTTAMPMPPGSGGWALCISRVDNHNYMKRST